MSPQGSNTFSYGNEKPGQEIGGQIYYFVERFREYPLLDFLFYLQNIGMPQPCECFLSRDEMITNTKVQS